jgi:antitoxin VapB
LAYLLIYANEWQRLLYLSTGQSIAVAQTAKLFINGRSQAVRLPAAHRFEAKEVFIRQDAESGDVILSRRPTTWDDFFAAAQRACAELPTDFLSAKGREQGAQNRDPFDGWQELPATCSTPTR